MNEETGWLIEHPHDPRYGRESWYAGKDGFTIDSLQAVRFARKEDAVREIDRFPLSLAKSLRAVEHAWYGGPSAGVPPMPTFDKEKLTELAALSAFDEHPTVTLANLAVFALHQTALFDNEKFLRTRDNDTWRQRHENLRDMWKLIGDSLTKYGYVGGGESSDVWPARVEGLLKEVEALRQRENQFADVLKSRDDQTNHAIRVNRDEAGQAGYDRALQDIGYTVSVGMIAAERRRQVEGESWTSTHDDGHDSGQLALAAACYAIESAGLGSRTLTTAGVEVSLDALGLYWPFERSWWKSGTPLRNLVKAGALIAAEIDRRLRAGEEP